MVASITPAWTAATTSSPGCGAHHVAHGVRGPRRRTPTNSRPRRDRDGGVAVPVGHPEPLDHLVPRHAVAAPRVQLAEVTALAHRAEGLGPGPTTGRSRSAVSTARGQHRGVQGRRLAQFAALVEPVGQRGHLPAPQVRQPGAALAPSHHPVAVALRLAVADEHDPRRALVGRKDPQHPRVGELVLGPRLTPGFRRSARAAGACGTPPRRRSARRTRPRSNRPNPSSRAAQGSTSRRGGPWPAGPRAPTTRTRGSCCARRRAP